MMSALEDRIKALEDSIEFWKKDSAAAWDQCEVRRLEAMKLSMDLDNLRGQMDARSQVFVISREGVFTKTVVGIFHGFERAKNTAQKLLNNEIDAYHHYAIYRFNINQINVAENKMCLVLRAKSKG